MIKIYNSLSQKKDEFIPVFEGKVGIYGCGVTPYKPSHLGHAMQGIIFDVMRRYFEYKGFDVTYVRNYTDIEDRIIDRAKEAGMEALEYSQMIIDQCDKDFDALRVRRADHTPKVSEFIDEIIKGVELLIGKGFAYATPKGNVYYSVAKFPEYGKLSKQRLDKMRIGVRKDLENDKIDVADFALWKASKEGEIFWESPWGKGRPGWHIECSIMSTHYLGKHFDIHGGGSDLLFPHHENEIAQSEAMNEGEFVNYWVHNGLLMVGDKKMSKSLNNDVSILDWLKEYHPEIIRYLILTNHYRSHVQFVPERYSDATKKVYQTYKTLKKLKLTLSDNKIKRDETTYQELIEQFEKDMDNDFNTVPVIASIHAIVTKINDMNENNLGILKSYADYIGTVSKVLGIFDLEPEKVLKEIEDLHLSKEHLTREEIEQQIKLRREYRANKEFNKSDEIRNKLMGEGITLLDRANETVWELVV